MALKASDIKVTSYCHVGDKIVPVSELTPEQLKEFSTKLKLTYLNNLFKKRGVEFFVAEE